MHQKSILIVDDDPSINELASMTLTGEGFIVYEALTGMRGFRLAKREKPDLVILDIMLPDIDGFEIFRKIKLDPETQGIPVLFLSALTTENAIHKGLCMGAKGYITKPFELRHLIKVIGEIIDEKALSTL